MHFGIHYIDIFIHHIRGCCRRLGPAAPSPVRWAPSTERLSESTPELTVAGMVMGGADGGVSGADSR